MSEFILCMGISGSGKTFYSKKWAEADPEHRVRLNYDDIRNMLGKYWVPNREWLVKKIFDTGLHQAMNAGLDIIIDNMSNLNPKHYKYYEDLVHSHNQSSEKSSYIINKIVFNTPYEECIRRDSEREIPIGEDVIKGQYDKYREYIYDRPNSELDATA